VPFDFVKGDATRHLNPHGDLRMLRRLYLTTLFALQLALLAHVAPRLGHALHADAALGALPGGLPNLVQIAGAAVAITGVALALVYPGVALLRHHQRGATRFHGLPRWAVALALAGAAALGVGLILQGLIPLLPHDAKLEAALIARPTQNAGLALAAAGTLCAELLRRGVGAARVATSVHRCIAERIEVTHPPELRTRGV
jgi:hypothetical protein